MPIALSIPTSASSSSSSVGTTNNVVSQRQTSPLLNSLDVAAAVMRQQASPLPQFLGPGLFYLFSFIFITIYKLFKIPLYHFVMFMVMLPNFMVHQLVFINHKI